jgi:hypothetical protein
LISVNIAAALRRQRWMMRWTSSTGTPLGSLRP